MNFAQSDESNILFSVRNFGLEFEEFVLFRRPGSLHNRVCLELIESLYNYKEFEEKPI